MLAKSPDKRIKLQEICLSNWVSQQIYLTKQTKSFEIYGMSTNINMNESQKSQKESNPLNNELTKLQLEYPDSRKDENQNITNQTKYAQNLIVTLDLPSYLDNYSVKKINVFLKLLVFS